MGKEKAPISSIELMRWGLFVIVFFSAHHPSIIVCNKADITLNECLYNVIDDLDVLLCYVCVCYYMCYFVWGG